MFMTDRRGEAGGKAALEAKYEAVRYQPKYYNYKLKIYMFVTDRRGETALGPGGQVRGGARHSQTRNML